MCCSSSWYRLLTYCRLQNKTTTFSFSLFKKDCCEMFRGSPFSFYAVLDACILEPVFTRNMCGFSSIILLQTRQKYAGGLSVAIHPSATLLCSRAESCLERSRPVSFFTQYAAKFAEKTLVYACEDRFLFPDAVIAVLFIHPSRQNPGLHGEYQQQQRQQAEHISAQCPGDIGDEIICRGMSGCR